MCNAPGVNTLALVKGTERYVWLYHDEDRADVLRSLGRFASDPELSFTWYDAAVLSQKVHMKAEMEAIMDAYEPPTPSLVARLLAKLKRKA
jgi:hypothetical protein